ncbi:non-canonical purine NTP diphosphatase [Flavobacteriaceae bacterium]|jgi:XTP/dITP diphosphohydrolase|nr:non-canonical purine NTP diphosphatase [Flavobacteriaceae bacterium]MDC0116375.1 non-canonical purine NTP diphosphatase [Flavobacteriaceae bacterium]|tara:strand:+ start:6143 stop:6724 length:582 start_codon:yes stop_codon:yes gene_type:complete
MIKHIDLIFATGNQNKLLEINKIIPNNVKIISLKDLKFSDDIPENENTIEGNAIYKAKYIYNKFNTNVFSDDTGLEVEALNGEPGVYSARYAGEACDSNDNINKLLKKLKKKKNRNARFKTIIALIIKNKIHTFEGIINGEILKNPIGENGFGYDSIFRPAGYSKSFAELSINEKNIISHRSLAIKKLINFIS